MLTNRSAPHARVTPVLTVSDVRAAVDWYQRAFGFVEHVRIGEGHRAQLGLKGGGELIVAEVRPGRRVPLPEYSHQVMLKLEDVAAVATQAKSMGATLLDEVRDWEYGERQVSMRDPFGHVWVLTQTLADIDPASWGGQTVVPR